MPTFKQLMQQEKPVLIDVFADWCGPCKALAPTIKQVKQKVGDRAFVIKVDIDKNQQFAAKHSIQGVPTLMLFKNGKLQWRQSGVLPEHQIMEKLNECMK